MALLWFTHIHMQDRLDKSHSALAEAQLKIEEAIGLEYTHISSSTNLCNCF